MVASAGPVQEIIPNAQQVGRIAIQLTQAIHEGKHTVTRDNNGIHVQLETPLNLAELGAIQNRMAEPACVKITVQDVTTTNGQLVVYDSNGVVMFRYGHPQTNFFLFRHLDERRISFNMDPERASQQIQRDLLEGGAIDETSLHMSFKATNSLLWSVFFQGDAAGANTNGKPAFHGSLTRTTLVPPRDGKSHCYVVWMNEERIYDGGDFGAAKTALKEKALANVKA